MWGPSSGSSGGKPVSLKKAIQLRADKLTLESRRIYEQYGNSRKHRDAIPDVPVVSMMCKSFSVRNGSRTRQTQLL